jgi:membrane-associated phospholipid phosphatase
MRREGGADHRKDGTHGLPPHPMHLLSRLTRTFTKPLFLCLAAMVLAIAGLAAAVMKSETVARADVAANQQAYAEASDHGTQWSFHITDLGGSHTVWLVTAAAALFLIAFRHWRGAIALLAAVASTQLVVDVLKLAVERPRPDHALTETNGFSFPSAHSATSMAVYATLTLLAARAVRGRPRLLIAVAGGLVVVAIGLTRIYLGAHYPTDVLAGWLTGAVIVLGSWALARRVPLPRLRAADAA